MIRSFFLGSDPIYEFFCWQIGRLVMSFIPPLSFFPGYSILNSQLYPIRWEVVEIVNVFCEITIICDLTVVKDCRIRFHQVTYPLPECGSRSCHQHRITIIDPETHIFTPESGFWSVDVFKSNFLNRKTFRIMNLLYQHPTIMFIIKFTCDMIN